MWLAQTHMGSPHRPSPRGWGERRSGARASQFSRVGVALLGARGGWGCGPGEGGCGKGAYNFMTSISRRLLGEDMAEGRNAAPCAMRTTGAFAV